MATKKKELLEQEAPVTETRYVGRRNSAGRYCST